VKSLQEKELQRLMKEEKEGPPPLRGKTMDRGKDFFGKLKEEIGIYISRAAAATESP